MVSIPLKWQHWKSFATFTTFSSNMTSAIPFKLCFLAAIITVTQSQFGGGDNHGYQDSGTQFRPNQHPHQGFDRQQKKKPDIIPAQYFNSLGNDGSRNFGYQTADGQQRVESTDADGTVRGSYSYMGPDGKQVKINYVADKNGFQASGPTIPQPPPAVAASNAANKGGKSHGNQGHQDYDYDDGSNDGSRDDGRYHGHGGGHHQNRGHFNFAPQNFQEQHVPHFGAGNHQQGVRPIFGFGGGNRREGHDYDDGYSGSGIQEFGGQAIGGQSQGSHFAPHHFNGNGNAPNQFNGNGNRFVENSRF